MDVIPLARLEREWLVLRSRLGPLWRAWAQEDVVLAAYPSPSALIRFLQTPGQSTGKDDVLGALLRRARSEPLAARVVLEALLPGLKALAGRLLFDPEEREDLWALLLACAWERIARYPLERRPGKIAANILFDTLADTVAFLRDERRRRAELTGEPIAAALAQGEVEVEALLARATRSGAVTRAETALILATRFERRPLADVAAEAGVAYNTMKLRRQRAERRLLLFLGYPPVPRGRQPAPSFNAGEERRPRAD